jgi:hypothetical protein
VDFVEGTCASIIGGCDSLDDFAFQSSAAAEAAARALLDQVFMDVADGNFDSLPALTFGCSAPDLRQS